LDLEHEYWKKLCLIGDTLSIYAYYYSNKEIVDSVRIIIDK
jgi:hypothetical protein